MSRTQRIFRGVASVSAVVALAAPVSTATAATAARPTGGDCYDGTVPPTVQQARLTTALPQGGGPVGPALVEAGGLDGVVSRFTTTLCSLTSAADAERAVAAAGTGLWRSAVDRAQRRGPGDTTWDAYDDRPLYWARLRMTLALRQWQPPFALDDTARAALRSALERGSRGLTSARLPADDGARRVLVSGFDPFGLDGGGLRNSNPAGGAALELDGRTLDTPDGPVTVQAVMLPVVWKDFEGGLVEDAFGTALTDHGHSPDLIMTISQGAGFTVERWAADWRGGAPDNDNASANGPVPGAPEWPGADPQFIETTLPYHKMISSPAGPATVTLNELYCVWPDGSKPGEGDSECRTDGTPPAPGEIAAMGGGGDFLSNESMYRANRVRLDVGAKDVPGGHLHVPPVAWPKDPTALTDREFEAARRAVVDQTIALVGTAGTAGTAGADGRP